MRSRSPANPAYALINLTQRVRFAALLLGACFTLSARAAPKEDIEFVAEHLIEVAMDNRDASLPIWNSAAGDSTASSFALAAAFSTTSTGNLSVEGPLLAAAWSRNVSNRWQIDVFGFYDRLALTGDNEFRPLQTTFAPSNPIPRPTDARFDNLDGTMLHYGGGISFGLSGRNHVLGDHRWVGGLMWQRVSLSDYRLDYQVLSGSATGTRGAIDFNADYAHISPFVGFESMHRWTAWAIAPHALFVLPIPKRGFVGHVSGPGFDIHGDTDQAGGDKPFGDPSLTIGLDVTYLPAHLSIDVGTLLTQRFLEPVIHKGIDANWVLGIRWRH